MHFLFLWASPQFMNMLIILSAPFLSLQGWDFFAVSHQKQPCVSRSWHSNHRMCFISAVFRLNTTEYSALVPHIHLQSYTHIHLIERKMTVKVGDKILGGVKNNETFPHFGWERVRREDLLSAAFCWLGTQVYRSQWLTQWEWTKTDAHIRCVKTFVN